MAETANLADMSDEFIGKTAVFAINDEIVEARSLADLNEVGSRMIGRHKPDDRFIRFETGFQIFTGGEHEFGECTKALWLKKASARWWDATHR
jgi:hypothetical protein